VGEPWASAVLALESGTHLWNPECVFFPAPPCKLVGLDRTYRQSKVDPDQAMTEMLRQANQPVQCQARQRNASQPASQPLPDKEGRARRGMRNSDQAMAMVELAPQASPRALRLPSASSRLLAPVMAMVKPFPQASPRAFRLPLASSRLLAPSMVLLRGQCGVSGGEKERIWGQGGLVVSECRPV